MLLSQFVDYLIYFVGHASRINFYIVWIREHTTIYISVAWSLLFSSSNMMCLLNVKIKVFLNFRKTYLKYVLIYFILIPFAVYFSSGTPIMHVLSPLCVFSTPIILPLILQNLKKQNVQVFWACHHYCYFILAVFLLFSASFWCFVYLLHIFPYLWQFGVLIFYSLFLSSSTLDFSPIKSLFPLNSQTLLKIYSKIFCFFIVCFLWYGSSSIFFF